MATLDPRLKDLKDADLPLSGAIGLRLTTGGVIEHIAFSITGGPGSIILPAPDVAHYNVRQMAIAGEIDEGLRRLTVKGAELDLGGPKMVLNAVLERRQTLPDPPKPSVAVVTSAKQTSVTGKRYHPQPGKSRSRSKVALPPPEPFGPPMPVETLFISGDTALTDVPINALRDYWPTGVAPNPRDWITHHLSAGVVTSAHFAAALHGITPLTLALDNLSGLLAVKGATVDYLTPMPRLRDVDGRVMFAPDRVDVLAVAGGVYGLKLTEAKVAVLGLDKPVQSADIDLAVEGPVTDALRLIDNNPLNYASKLGINPSQTGGKAEAHIKLMFPLRSSLPLDKVIVSTDAMLKGFSLKGAVFDRDLSDGMVNMRVTATTLETGGTAALAGVPIRLEWRENFSPGVEPRSHYQVNGKIDDAGRHGLGFDFPPLGPESLLGPVQTDLSANINHDGRGTFAVRTDLSAAEIRIPPMNWKKPPAVTASANVEGRFAGGALKELSRFTVVTGNGLDVRGKLGLAEAGRLWRIDFDRIRLNRTDLRGSVIAEPDGAFAIKATGAGFDAFPLLSDHTAKGANTAVTPLSLNLTTDRLWVSKEGFLDKARFKATRTGQGWKHVSLDAVTGTNGSDVTLRLAPKADGAGEFTITSADAGAVLRAFDIYDNLIDGKLDVAGTVGSDDVYRGNATITEFRVIKAPLLAKLLTMAALTGIPESLTGDGLYFTTMVLPFTWDSDKITVAEARAHGLSLGLTAKGEVSLEHDTINLEGTIVPIYSLNSLLGNLPLLGGLLTGEKGGGVFAATYSMSGNTAAPEISVNPLAVLTPGFLRRLFNLFDETGKK
ncbi:MAG: AsmA-like C-terminal domain-containing protein [Alphaproteobacteria bacterium]|nr:AsmA-like C-terminal domain-containing protein [Alphaproteobacteria bacterium]